jgi:hypothetical protein
MEAMMARVKSKSKSKVGVTMRAAIQRINRRLAIDNGYVLKVTRGDRWRDTLGDYYSIDPKENCIVETDVDPEHLGRKLGVLKGYEQVTE